MWFSEFQNRVSPEFLERHGIISDAQNMTGSQRASLSLIGGMTAGIFSVFGNNRTFRRSRELVAWMVCYSCFDGCVCAKQRLMW